MGWVGFSEWEDRSIIRGEKMNGIEEIWYGKKERVRSKKAGKYRIILRYAYPPRRDGSTVRIVRYDLVPQLDEKITFIYYDDGEKLYEYLNTGTRVRGLLTKRLGARIPR